MQEMGELELITLSLPADAIKRLEEEAQARRISISEQAERLVKDGMRSAYPPRTENERRLELKEAKKDLLGIWRQFFGELFNNLRRVKVKENTQHQPSHVSHEISDETGPLQEVSIRLSTHRVQKLKEISQQRGSSVSDEASRMVHEALATSYRKTSKEEQSQDLQNQSKELRQIWHKILWSKRK